MRPARSKNCDGGSGSDPDCQATYLPTTSSSFFRSFYGERSVYLRLLVRRTLVIPPPSPPLRSVKSSVMQ